MRIDVVLLLYQRPTHTRAVLDSLVMNGVERVRAFVDYAAESHSQERQARLLRDIEARTDIQVDVYRHTQRQGLAASVRFALNTTLMDADAAIVLEDDCVVHPGGIQYFREGLTRLAGDRRIRSVCGYLYPCPFVRDPGAPLLLNRFSPWGWGTWRDRWMSHDTDVARQVLTLKARGIHLPDFAGDLAALCARPEYLENRVDIWSVAWALEHYASDTYAVYPDQSLIHNIGFDGSGQHCPPTPIFDTVSVPDRRAWSWDRLVHHRVNEELLKEFLDQHGSTIYPAA